MTDRTSLSRRELINVLTGGALIGGLWATAFTGFATEDDASLSVVGGRGAQVVIVDSKPERALILVGMPDDHLLERLPAMMTIFRQRIDIIIGSHVALEHLAASFRSRWNLSHAVVLRSDVASTPLSMATTTVVESARIDLGRKLTIDCHVGHRGEWSESIHDTEDDYWCIQIDHAAGRVIIAPNAASLETITLPAASLLVVPEAPPKATLHRVQVSAIAANEDAKFLPDLAADIPLTRIYPIDVARFELTGEKLRLPPWTQQSHTPGTP